MQGILKWVLSIGVLIFLFGAAGVSFEMNLGASKLMVGLGFGVWLFIVSNFLFNKNKSKYRWISILILMALCFILLIFMGLEAK